jgi:hypothetical protein
MSDGLKAVQEAYGSRVSGFGFRVSLEIVDVRDRNS